MIKNLYLIRHGETLFNQRNIIQGVINAPLVLDGVAQAIHTRKAYFESRNIHYDHVYCSPEGRCIQTTQLLTTLPYTTVIDLHEMCFGKLEGCPGFLAAPVSEFATYYANYGGETLAQVQERMNRALLEIMNKEESENVLVVAHSCANHAFMDYWAPDGKIPGPEALNYVAVLHFQFDTDTQTFALLDIFNDVYAGEDLEEAKATHQALILDPKY